MKVLLCGEGAHEVGEERSWDGRVGRYVVLDGWMQPLVRNALPGASPEFSIRMRKELQVMPRDPHRRRLPAGHGAKAYIAKRAAVLEGFDLLIFMVDADSNEVADRRRIATEIEAGFALLPAEIHCIACVPMSASESWLLSDGNAWTIVTGRALVDLPPRPETLWGDRDDPSGNHPHRLFRRICDGAGIADDRATRAEIASRLSLPSARSRCPISLEPFLAALQP